MADEALVQKLAQNGQIATQYVDLEGNPTSNIRFNPNNSVQAIEESPRRMVVYSAKWAIRALR